MKNVVCFSLLLGIAPVCAADAPADLDTSKTALGGWFAGLGVSYGGYRTNVDEFEHWYTYSNATGVEMSTDLDAVRGDFAAAGALGEFVGSPRFNENNVVFAVLHRNSGGEIARNKLSKLGASFVCGWGGFDGNLYYGAQAVVEVSGNGKTRTRMGAFGDLKAESGGVRPYFELMLGRYFNAIGALVYLKGGVTYSHGKLSSGNGSIKLGEVAPLVGIGVKKVVSDKVVLCTEAGYVFESSKKGSLRVTESGRLGEGDISFSHEMVSKVRNCGYNVRVFATVAL